MVNDFEKKMNLLLEYLNILICYVYIFFWFEKMELLFVEFNKFLLRFYLSNMNVFLDFGLCY